MNPIPTIKNLVVYISGSISADPDFKKKFAHWEEVLTKAEAKLVLNPASLSPGWTYQDYMKHCLLMVERADVVLMLPCWRNSPGAIAECSYASSLKKRIIYINSEPCLFKSLQNDVARWSKKTFPQQTVESKMNHLNQEFMELWAAPHDGQEMADMVILLLGLAALQNIDLFEEVRKKHEINQTRKWGQPDENGVVKHIEE